MSGQSARAHEVGSFLRRKRTSLTLSTTPADDLLRRTTGLRREEVARIAGVSLGYYIRLEQGRASQPSASVLGAVARALQLSDDELGYLFALAEYATPRPVAPSEPPADAHKLLEVFAPPTAAYVIDQVSDVVGWNPVAEALFPHLHRTSATPPNNVRFVFTDPAARDLFVDWELIASDSTAHLRAAAGHQPDNPRLRALIAEVSARSPEFVRMWKQTDVRRKKQGAKRFFHPEVGMITLDYQVLEVAAAPDQRIVAYTSDEPDTRSALQALADAEFLH